MTYLDAESAPKVPFLGIFAGFGESWTDFAESAPKVPFLGIFAGVGGLSADFPASGRLRYPLYGEKFVARPGIWNNYVGWCFGSCRKCPKSALLGIFAGFGGFWTDFPASTYLDAEGAPKRGRGGEGGRGRGGEGERGRGEKGESASHGPVYGITT